MDKDDIVYLLILISSIGFGKIYRKIENKTLKKNVGTLVGFIVAFIVSGRAIWHLILTTAVNAFFITCLKPKLVHVASFGFSFVYLLFFRMTTHFGIPYPPAHTNLIEMILILKMVGMAFEVKDAVVGDAQGRTDEEFKCTKVPQPSFIDVFHYAFCYVGILTGPYFTYRTYLDMISTPFGKYAKCGAHTLERLKYLPLYGIMHLALNHFYPFNVLFEEDWYEKTSVSYRLWYSVPVFAQFRTRMYIGMRMSEGVFIMAGAGAYPTATEPKPGKGPSKEFHQIALLGEDEKRARNAQYSFETVHNVEPAGADFYVTVRKSMKAWNMSVQYWLAAYVYSRFPVKYLRIPATFAVSSFWHGVYAGYYCTLCSVPFYLPIEDIYYKNLRDVKVPQAVAGVAWIPLYMWKIFLMGYWGITFRLLTLEASFRYWRSVLFLPHLITLVMLAVSFLIFPKRRSRKDLSGTAEGDASKRE